MPARIALLLMLLAGAAAGAELYTLDRDPISSRYIGPSGPLVLSGELVAGDYERLLTRLAEDPDAFLASNRLVLAVSEGDVSEAIRIAELLKTLFTEVDVGPLTGRCSGPCVLMYVAAARRGTDGGELLGLYAPADPDQVRQLIDYLTANAVPSDLIERLQMHTRAEPYWLSAAEENVLGPRSASFEALLGRECGWSAGLERAVYAGERPLEDLKRVWDCRDRYLQPLSRRALCSALSARNAAKAPPSGSSSSVPGLAADATRGRAPDVTRGRARPVSARSLPCSAPLR